MRARRTRSRRLVLCENMRAVPYVPFYLALAGGYWQTEGLDIQHVVSPATSNTPLKLLEGSADVSWGGPMRVLMHHDADPRCPLVCFGQVVARDPFVLVGRGRRPAFRFQDLAGLRVAAAGDVPTPWMTFQDDLQRAGLDPARIAGRRVRPMARNLGDMMARWTNDRWTSTLHRVVNPPVGSARSRRLSIGMFVHPNYDQSIACVPTCVAPGEQPRYPAISAGEHIQRKIEASHAVAA
jgi:NMT1/THI5 like